MPSLPRPVLDPPAATPAQVEAHVRALLAFETDCADVHAAMRRPEPGFVLLDVRSSEAFAAGHVPGARSLPYRHLTPRALADVPAVMLHVVYCSGPHCNGADRAALRLAMLGRPVKKMLGGVTGWLDEGFDLTLSS